MNIPQQFNFIINSGNSTTMSAHYITIIGGTQAQSSNEQDGFRMLSAPCSKVSMNVISNTVVSSNTYTIKLRKATNTGSSYTYSDVMTCANNFGGGSVRSCSTSSNTSFAAGDGLGILVTGGTQAHNTGGGVAVYMTVTCQ